MELKDVLKFYLPIAVELNNGGSKVYNRIAVAVGNTDDEFTYVTLRMGTGAKSFTHSVLLSENSVKPILRPLCYITEEQVIKLIRLKSDVYLSVKHTGNFYDGVDFEFKYDSSSRRRRSCQKWSELNPAQFLYLLKQGFDLFNLIESGQAINKTKLNP